MDFRIINKPAMEAVQQVEDKSISCIVTSPPYWGLRVYGVEGQLGLEGDFKDYVANLVQTFNELKPKLRDDGCLWVNLGDTYAGGGGLGIPHGMSKKDIKDHWNIGEKSQEWSDNRIEAFPDHTPQSKIRSIMGKSQIGIPERFKIAMIDAGWLCRNTIIWHKPNPMPESVRDRFTRDFEYVFFFSKKKKYYFDQQFEPMTRTDENDLYSIADTIRRSQGIKNESKTHVENHGLSSLSGTQRPAEEYLTTPQIIEKLRSGEIPMPLGRNKRTVWYIKVANSKVPHFAVFPEELVETPILASTPREICRSCDKPVKNIYKATEQIDTRPGDNTGTGKSGNDGDPNKGLHQSDLITKRTISVYGKVGEKRCSCKDSSFYPGTVLDPFSGSGTTGIVAYNNGFNYIGFEINPEYAEISLKRWKEECTHTLDEWF